MRYGAFLEITAGQEQETPDTKTMPVCAGVVVDVDVMFPAGSSGLVYVQVWYHERQVFPQTGGGAFRGDDHLFQFPDSLVLDEQPFTLELRGWAPDATLNHTVFVQVTVVPTPEDIAPMFAHVPLPEGMGIWVE